MLPDSLVWHTSHRNKMHTCKTERRPHSHIVTATPHVRDVQVRSAQLQSQRMGGTPPGQ
jgi:hypothetical protein